MTDPIVEHASPGAAEWEPHLPALETVQHTVIVHDAQGQAHVQKLGKAHVVEGSVRVFDVAPGEQVFFRVIAPPSP